MMIDFALDAERQEGMPPREAIYQACLLRLPADPDDDDGGDARRVAADARHGTGRSCASRSASPSSAASIVSQVLTLFTTPVIYLAFDRLARRVAPARRRAGMPEDAAP